MHQAEKYSLQGFSMVWNNWVLVVISRSSNGGREYTSEQRDAVPELTEV